MEMRFNTSFSWTRVQYGASLCVAHSSRSTEIVSRVSGGERYSVVQTSVWLTLREGYEMLECSIH